MRGRVSRSGASDIVVMAGLDPAIHQKRILSKGWIAGSSPAMTIELIVGPQNTSCLARDSENPLRSALKHVTPVCSDLQVMPLFCQTSP
jgi:hypothetical protein